jgi:anti-sigma regulatory factor (Ser/Thr protein kinase)
MARVRQISVIVEERSQVAAVRRETAALGAALGFGQQTLGRLAIAVTEAATNIVKHAGRGRIFARSLDAGPVDGLEIVAIDRGPGMPNIAAGMADGYSTSGTPGNGLGSISRMSAGFEIYSLPGRGTCQRFEVWPDARPRPPLPIESGVITVPKNGEMANGDTCAVSWHQSRCNVMVTDGLGHGPEAAQASQAAAQILLARPEREAADAIDAIHRALGSTRGGAGAVATLDIGASALKYCGIGNISGILYVDYKSRHLISHNGTLGHNARKIQQVDFDFPRGALLIMHSDGLATHWSLDDYPGLAARHPALIAAALYRDHDRGRDDVSVVVMRNTGA